jgi:uncharacterized membrane protein (DUF4010 family)
VPDLEVYKRIGLALALGLLVGIERGWHYRERPEGHRVAGMRTFALIGLLGGVVGVIALEQGLAFLVVGFAVMGALVVAGYLLYGTHNRSFGQTTEVAALLTFSLGVLAAVGRADVAGAAAVAAIVILGLKQRLHGWVSRLEAKEIHAGMQLLLISVVVLPLLPDVGYGPWGALNPHEIWLFVVLIASISFVGYVTVKAVGPEKGILATGIFGGLASSTALTISFARMAKGGGPALLLAAGVAIASGIMFPRILAEVSVVNPALLRVLWPPVAAMAVTAFAGAAWLWWRARGDDKHADDVELKNPMELGTALKLGLLLAAIMLLTEALRRWLGEAGVYIVAGVAGLTDVDAITLSLSDMARRDLDEAVAVRGIVIAAVVNTAVKFGWVAWLAGGRMARAVGVVLGATVLVGLIAVTIQSGWIPLP